MRSNMDIQLVHDAHSVAVYIVDLIQKSDRGVSDTLQSVLKEIQSGNYSLHAALRKLGNTYYNNCKLRVQEACCNILQLSMSEAATSCMYIPTSPPEERVKIVKSRRNWKMLTKIHPIFWSMD